MLGTKAAVGSFHLPQFITANEKMVMEMVQEAHDRKVSLNKNTTPDIQSYFNQRRLTVGTVVYFVFVRLTRCLYITDDVLANPAVQEMENAAADMIIISNVSRNFSNCAHPPKTLLMLHPGYLLLQEGI